jgi:hypothetical protein
VHSLLFPDAAFLVCCCGSCRVGFGGGAIDMADMLLLLLTVGLVACSALSRLGAGNGGISSCRQEPYVHNILS